MNFTFRIYKEREVTSTSRTSTFRKMDYLTFANIYPWNDLNRIAYKDIIQNKDITWNDIVNRPYYMKMNNTFENRGQRRKQFAMVRLIDEYNKKQFNRNKNYKRTVKNFKQKEANKEDFIIRMDNKRVSGYVGLVQRHIDVAIKNYTCGWVTCPICFSNVVNLIDCCGTSVCGRCYIHILYYDYKIHNEEVMKLWKSKDFKPNKNYKELDTYEIQNTIEYDNSSNKMDIKFINNQ